MSNELTTEERKTPLGGKIPMEGDHKYDEETIQKDLEKYGLKEEETFVVTNPISGNSKEVTISRTGTTAEKFIAVFQDPQATQQQKDSILSAYLWERGKESAAFLAEIFASKGAHTRETQAFKRQMRFDYEMFADVFVRFLQECSSDMKSEEDPKKAIEKLATRFEATSEMLEKRIKGLTEDRMRGNGYGIYIDRNGKVFDTRSEEIVQRVQDDVNSEKEEKEED